MMLQQIRRRQQNPFRLNLRQIIADDHTPFYRIELTGDDLVIFRPRNTKTQIAPTITLPDWAEEKARAMANLDRVGLADFAQQKRQVNASKEWIKVKLTGMSMFRAPDKEDYVVVTFEQDYRSNNLNNQMKKRQYWVREKGTWKIIYEGAA